MTNIDDLQKFECPIRKSVEIIKGKWTFSIIFLLMRDGTMRYSQLARYLNMISDRMLSKELDGIEQIGLVIRNAYPTVPPTVEYTLTEKGKDLFPIAEALKVWGKKYSHDIAD
jgi:DNA-binding HxlR family transcriptional regulator